MLSSFVVSQIKACAERGDRVGEISDAFRISRQSVAKIITGRSHPRVRAARSVPSLAKLAEDFASQEREVARLAEIERRRVLKDAQDAIKAVIDADPDVQAARQRLKDIQRRSQLALTPTEREALGVELADVNREGKDALERARERAPGR